jgi:hypothetical protein
VEYEVTFYALDGCEIAKVKLANLARCIDFILCFHRSTTDQDFASVKVERIR